MKKETANSPGPGFETSVEVTPELISEARSGSAIGSSADTPSTQTDPAKSITENADRTIAELLRVNRELSERVTTLEAKLLANMQSFGRLRKIIMEIGDKAGFGLSILSGND